MSKYSNLKLLDELGLNVPSFIKYTNQNELNKYLFKYGGDALFAVRSSANMEDSKEFSFAGILETLAPVKKMDIINAVNKVKKSGKTAVVKEYCDTLNIDRDKLIVEVIVQEFVSFNVSGVCFFDGINLHLEYIKGDLSSLVDGKVEPNIVKYADEGVAEHRVVHHTKYLLNGSERKIPMLDASKKKINNEKILEIYEAVKKIYNKFGCSIDCELGFANDKLIFVQVRPVTTHIKI